MMLKPMSEAQPSSRSMVAGSKLCACHISSWLIAVEGMKLQPTSHGCLSYQAPIFSCDQRPVVVIPGCGFWAAKQIRDMDNAASVRDSKTLCIVLRASHEL